MAADRATDGAVAIGRTPIVTTLDGLEMLAFALVAITSGAIAEATAGDELSFQQWRILVVLGIDSGIRVSDLAARISASGPSTSRLCQRLARRGLVKTAADVSDRRVTRVALSADGADLRQAIVDQRRKLIDRMIGDAAQRPFPGELAAITAALQEAI